LTISDPSKRDEHTAIIQKSMNEMAQTIRQLRYFAHKATLVKKNVSLSSIVPRLLSSYPSLIVENQQTADMVVADAQALEEMIASLMNNAVMASHTAEGEEKRITMLLENISSLPPSIPVKIKKKMASASSWIHVVVSDTGVGIDPESMSTIFAPFAPIKPYAPIDGAVLGLASAQAIAKQHGGIIEAESVLGKGTNMHIYLPLKEEEIPRDPKKGNPVHEKNDIPRGNGEYILVVEDEISLLQAIQEILESLGYTVITAQNGQQALEKIKEKKPDLILSDIVMPVMNGINLAQALQKDFSSSQIIMMSGYSRKDDMDILEKIGVSQFIRKPFPIRTLALAVHNSIQSIQAEREQKKTE
jgi:CheY-like chemotaxis protein